MGLLTGQQCSVLYGASSRVDTLGFWLTIKFADCGTGLGEGDVVSVCVGFEGFGPALLVDLLGYCVFLGGGIEG
jgi:hypothetical protein